MESEQLRKSGRFTFDERRADADNRWGIEPRYPETKARADSKSALEYGRLGRESRLGQKGA